MANYTLGEILAIARNAMASSTGADVVRSTMLEAITSVKALPWPWNTKTVTGRIPDAVTEALATFQTTRGSPYLFTTSGSATAGFNMAGRYVRIGRRWYRVLAAGYPTAARYELDRPVEETLTGLQPTFYRGDVLIRTTQVHSFFYDGYGVPGLMVDSFEHAGILDSDPGIGVTPRYHTATFDSDYAIPAPKYAPTYATTIGTGPPVGKYIFYWTRYCTETGRESAPGPRLAIDWASPGVALTVNYGGPGSVSDETSYVLRLYRTAVNPPSIRPPTYFQGQKSPDSSAPLTVSATTGTGIKRNDGRQAVINLRPFLSTGKNWSARVTDSFDTLADDETIINVEPEAMEFFKLFGTIIAQYQKGSTFDAAAALARFNRHLEYTLKKSKGAASTAFGAPNNLYHSYVDPLDEWKR